MSLLKVVVVSAVLVVLGSLAVDTATESVKEASQSRLDRINSIVDGAVQGK